MKKKNKFKSYSFWMSVCAAVVLVVNNLAKAFGFSFDNQIFTATVDSVCGVLVVFGVLTMTKSDKNKKETSKNGQNDAENSAQNKEIKEQSQKNTAKDK